MAFFLVPSSFARKSRVSLAFLKQTALGRSFASDASKPSVAASAAVSKSVFISQSRDVYTNLALEDWMYKNFDFSNHHVMLLWRNDPCVVIGRHQNPWVETDVERLESKGVVLARRNSGGGSVYHDSGNLNITFFAPRERYNRRENLQIVARTLEKEWSLHPTINAKDDIILDNNYKISGTASKLGRPNSYHHCTLLVDVDKDALRTSLRKAECMAINSNATASVPSPTVNLVDLHSGITMEKLMSCIGWQFLRTDPATQADAGWKQAGKTRGFQMINPTDDWFPGLQKIKDEFSDWSWVMGKTPKFDVVRRYEVGGSGSGVWVEVEVTVERGLVADVTLRLPDGLIWDGLSGQFALETSQRGARFSRDVFTAIGKALKNQESRFARDTHAARNGGPIAAAARA